MDFVNLATEINDNKFSYSKIVGSLYFASQGSWPNTTYNTNNASKFTKNPKPSHISGVKCIMKYLKDNLNLHISYKATSCPNTLHVYCNGDFGVDFDDKKSWFGFVVTLNDGPMAWGSHKQDCIVGQMYGWVA